MRAGFFCRVFCFSLLRPGQHIVPVSTLFDPLKALWMMGSGALAQNTGTHTIATLLTGGDPQRNGAPSLVASATRNYSKTLHFDSGQLRH